MPSSQVITDIILVIVGVIYLFLATGASLNGRHRPLEWMGRALAFYTLFKVAPFIDGRENFISSFSPIKYFFLPFIVIFIAYYPIIIYKRRKNIIKVARLIAVSPMTWYLITLAIIIYILFFSIIGKEYLTISLLVLFLSNMIVFSQLLAFINKRIIVFRHLKFEDFNADNNYIAFALTLSMLILLISVYGRIYSGEWMNYEGCKPIPLRSALYFSMVTWTTLGYGDIVPCGAWQKFFVMLEAFSGYAYGSLLVAAIIEIFRGRR